jgi:hypothetical protein
MAGTFVADGPRNDRSPMNQHEGVGRYYEAGLLAPKRGYRRFDVSIAADPGCDWLHGQRSGSGFERAQEISSAPGAVSGLNMIATRLTRGAISLSSPSHLPPNAPLDVSEPRDVST